MSAQRNSRKPLLSLPQVIALAVVIVSLMTAIDLARKERAGKLVGVDEPILRERLASMETREAELRVTLEYVKSDDYVEEYARSEAGQLLPGEKRVVPLIVPDESASIPRGERRLETVSQGPISPWMVWWRLLTDAPLPFVRQPDIG